jgi:hypothetical protein
MVQTIWRCVRKMWKYLFFVGYETACEKQKHHRFRGRRLRKRQVHLHLGASVYGQYLTHACHAHPTLRAERVPTTRRS